VFASPPPPGRQGHGGRRLAGQEAPGEREEREEPAGSG
jgi:hypothetical protein